MAILLDILGDDNIKQLVLNAGLSELETILGMRAVCKDGKLLTHGVQITCDFIATGTEEHVLNQLLCLIKQTKHYRNLLEAPAGDFIRHCAVTIAQKPGGSHVKGRPSNSNFREDALQQVAEILVSEKTLACVSFCSLDGWDCIGKTVAEKLGLNRRQAGWRQVMVGRQQVKVHHTAWCGDFRSR
eukprot:gnl/TRDRNA2_/TRDRNA2_200744_c0_seq1.p1 gnl/TRDRNA2_/TRDRNA2_200744_c0~~gnl/TRDRNA2_/TRDRNA2_200744_c0_seq1.p1  ORF type:complete len:185 (-),score=20.80 gnl/TRDRNA2_/TRDRNA2_200744_c0_seq1:236-790(-)